jgi:prepilin-type processing-associated H-X9-DG protein
MNYESARKAFPLSRWGDKTAIYDNTSLKSNQQSWTSVALPYMEENGIASMYDPSQAWHSQANRPAVSQTIKMFICPSVPTSNRADATYVKGAIAGDYGSVNGVKSGFWTYYPQLGPYPVESRPPVVGVLNKYQDGNNALLPACKIKNITDGTSKTIMVAEDAGRPDAYDANRKTTGAAVANGIGWADPDNGYSLSKGNSNVMNNTNDSEVYSFHVGGAQFCFADGSAHFLREAIDPLVFMALITRAGGENIPPDSF